MLYTIRANHKVYEVSEHAIERMNERDISEEMVIATLEHGTLFLQYHGVDRYEKNYVDKGSVRIIQVAVNETYRIVVSVIDDSEAR